jgi:hypothetical membrane protein
VLSFAAVFVVVLYCAFTFTSIALFPTAFSPVVNYLSDLGNSTFNPTGAWFYNAGCILTGLALLPFYAGFYEWYTVERRRKSLMVLTQVVGFLSAFSLIMIGVFSEDSMAQHLFWSELFFVFNLLVLILANISLMTRPKFIRPIGYYGLAVAVVNLLFVVLTSTPLLEWFTVFTALVYAGLLAYNTLKLTAPASTQHN